MSVQVHCGDRHPWLIYHLFPLVQNSRLISLNYDNHLQIQQFLKILQERSESSYPMKLINALIAFADQNQIILIAL